MNRRYTAIHDTPDVRDHIAAPAASNIPTSFSLAQWLPDVRNQGSVGACTAFAASGILAWHYNRFMGKKLEFSPQFGYRAERIIEGTTAEDAGAESRTMMKVLTQYGLCLESSDPYVEETWNHPTTFAQLAEARNYRLGAYHRVPDLATLRSVIASGYVASIAIDVYESFESDSVTKTGMIPIPDPSKEKLLGGHEIYVYAYGSGGITCRNSWGSDWGTNGDFYLPNGYESFISDMWTCHFGKPW